jgi:site-specific recombinase XerD
MAGVNLKAVQVIMGHRTIAMTIQYSHLRPNHMESVMEAMASDAMATAMATDPQPVATK